MVELTSEHKTKYYVAVIPIRLTKKTRGILIQRQSAYYDAIEKFVAHKNFQKQVES
jgi:hypothetical protein